VAADTNIVYLQAANDAMRLRVNDLTGDFSNNTGDLDVEVYHVTYNRVLQDCEKQFGEMVPVLVESASHIIIDAKKENGVTFAGEFDSTFWQRFIEGTGGLISGEWYVMETSDGPWNYPGLLHAGSSYETAVSTDGGETWVNLADWDYPVCNVQIDGFGHRRVYFQIPELGEPLDPTVIKWTIRVNDTAGWTNNVGWMSFELYRVTNLGTNDCSAYIPSDTPIGSGIINGDNEEGVYVEGLLPDALYNIVISTGTDDWFEEPNLGGDPHDEMQIDYGGIEDNGWQNIEPQNGDVALCQEITESGDLSIVINTGNVPGVEIKLRVGPSTDYEDNSGHEHYTVYETTGGPLADHLCFSDWNLTVVVPYDDFFPPLQLGADYSDGQIIYSASTTYNSGGEQVFDTPEWNPMAGIYVLPGLFPDESGSNPPETLPDPNYTGGKYGIYAVEIPVEAGPWYDGENDGGRFDAQVSPDNGTTWYDMSDRSNPDVICAEQTGVNQLWKILVHVEPGQIWKIRIADTDTTTFDDDTGTLAYKVWSGSNDQYPQNPYPNDTDNNGFAYDLSATSDYCSGAIPMPSELLPEDYGVEDVVVAVLGIGGYISNWIVFGAESLIRYFSWCDRHTIMVLGMINLIKEREPFATLDDIAKVETTIAGDLNGYNWDSAGEDYSILNSNSTSFMSTMDTYLLPPTDENSPWGGGALVPDLGSGENPYSMSCSLAVTDYLGPYLGPAMCFVTDILNKTGMMFFVQLLLDLATLFLVFTVMYNTLVDSVSVMTGVSIPRLLRGTSVNIPSMQSDFDKIQNRKK
jgi:hypothetical protein